MFRAPMRRRSPGLAALGALAVVAAWFASSTPAHAQATPRVHALVNARIVPAPGQVIPRGTVVMRDGIITAVGANVAVPADARVWDAESLTVYPGLVDAFVLSAGKPAESLPGRGPGGARPRVQPASQARGAAHELASVQPERRIVESLPLEKEQLESLRAAGFAVAQIVPGDGIVRGQSAVIGLADAPSNRVVVRADAAQVMSLEAMQNTYPGSLMGGIAVIRQALLDAKWYRDVHAAYAKRPVGRERPAENVSWAALDPVVAGRQPVLFMADEMLEVLRASALAREAAVQAMVLGAGDEYKRAKDIAATGTALIVPVNFPDAPDVSDPGLALEVTTEQLRYWNDAPANAAALKRAGVTFALTAHGLKDVKNFRTRVAEAIARGLAEDAALAAVTTTPARLLGLSDRLGTLAPGKIANLTVTRGALFSESGKVREVWVDGARHEVAKDESSPKGNWTVSWGPERHTLMVAAEKDTTVKLIVGSDTLSAKNVRLEEQRLRFLIERGSDKPEAFDLEARNDRVSGTLTVAGVGSHEVSGSRMADDKKKDDRASAKQEPVASPAVMGNTEPWRMTPPPAPAAVVVRNATVWTAGKDGVLENADVLVRGGKIAAVGRNLPAPSGATIVDGTGKHVAPGILDAHSHAAILGNVNECTNIVTAEVRIQDVVNSESVNIYRQLAGGTTVMHLLHGSCNSIGGQAAVIKNKWGETPDRLLMPGVIPTIKFALGENPKQSNWGGEATGRYPQTRPGVEQSIRDAFTRARDYRAAQADFKAGRRAYPPKPDLQLEAVAEIVEGRRMIHSHAYRADEMLMLMRVAEEFGIKVQCFQHTLEGYKIADEMAKHGAGASTFSDWWAYKYEVIDAIPWNATIMWDRGVDVSYNSDSDELARHLNTEAAKAVKYGGMPREEAIKLVTLNPAKQLRIADRVGSLEAGKDADFAIWSGSPLSPYSYCLETWIEGRKYFDRAQDLAGREELAKERAALIARARGAKKDNGPRLAGNWPPRYLEDSDRSGNACGSEHGLGDEFMSEALRRALRSGEVQR